MKANIRNLLVLGSSGNIGTEIVRSLQDDGQMYGLESVHLVDKQPNKDILLRPPFHFHALDILDADHALRLIDIIDQIPRLAILNLITLDFTAARMSEGSLSSFSPSEEELMLVLRLNVAFPYSLAKSLASRSLSGIRLVHIGSVYGLRMPRPSLYSDNGDCVKPAPYAISKAAMIALVKYSAYELSRSKSECFMISLGGVNSDAHPGDFQQRYKSITEGLGLLDTSNTVSALLQLVIFLPFNLANGSNLILDNGYTIF